MKTKSTLLRGFTLVELLVVIAIIATLAGVGVPALMAKKKEGDRSEALMNSKQIGLALFGFDDEYGSYPSADTAKSLEENNPNSGMTFGSSSSNDYFRQLIAAGYVDQEKPFYARSPYTKKPDNNLSGSKALAEGECGFAYIMASATAALTSSGNSGRPLICAAVDDAKTDGTFDVDVYNRKAVVLRLDTSASVETIRPSDKKVTVGGGKTLLDTGDDTVWGTGTTPTIVPPLKATGK